MIPKACKVKGGGGECRKKADCVGKIKGGKKAEVYDVNVQTLSKVPPDILLTMF